MSRDQIHAVLMPKWGLAMHEGTIADWHVGEGDEIAEGAPLCDIETNKIANEFEAPCGGRVVRLLKAVNDMASVGEVIAVIAQGDALEADIDALIAEHAAAAREAEDEAAGGPRQVETRAGPIACLEAGPEDASATVLLLHGFGGDHGNWDLLMGALPDDLRIVAPDLPGHGGSTREVGDGSAKAMARAVSALMDALPLERVHLVAHSFGATVAAAVAAGAPERIASLCVIAPPALGARVNRDYVEGFVAARRKKDMRPVMEMLFSDPEMVSRSMVNETIAQYREPEARAAITAIGKALLAAPRSDMGRDLKALSGLGGLVIWGDADRVVPMPDGLADAAGDRLVVIAGAGHMPHAEKPEEVARHIAGQIASRSRP